MKYGPKKHNDVWIGKECLACGLPFKQGDFTTKICIGPGNDPLARQRCKEGKTYTPIEIEVHWECSEEGNIP